MVLAFGSIYQQSLCLWRWRRNGDENDPRLYKNETRSVYARFLSGESGGMIIPTKKDRSQFPQYKFCTYNFCRPKSCGRHKVIVEHLADRVLDLSGHLIPFGNNQRFPNIDLEPWRDYGKGLSFHGFGKRSQFRMLWRYRQTY